MRDWGTGELMNREWYRAAISYLDGSGHRGRADSVVFQVLCVCVCVCLFRCVLSDSSVRHCVNTVRKKK